MSKKLFSIFNVNKQPSSSSVVSVCTNVIDDTYPDDTLSSSQGIIATVESINIASDYNDSTFTSIGFNNWKKLSGSRGKKGNKQSKLHGHSTSKQHLTCMAKWEAYISTIRTGSVHSQVASSHKLLVEKNVQCIKTLVDITLFLSCQRLAFRGHEESKLSLNHGNFKEICSLIAKHYPEFAEKFQNTTNYTSHAVQDEFANLCAKNIRHKIIKEIEDTKVFSIMCDEARCFKQEQMSLCVRYTVGLNIVELFLGFIVVSDKQDAEFLSAHIFA
ncbi:uncharacterized protein LOC103307776 [Acyrthosiphon pisum]|uniref:DUF4371 domain-containing protein n=1 Tax=Acyrthosiphon pisum TaxID=7029 RepID=A0A8R1WXY2_ACYPI|nr:uncharacterized protein LOC103307776 [Acyrthosiphon pisum]|eukprot:XP_008178284.1 PREDICTED: uncharacterized protein LOC103307776 [Acyrthosiphon pisum]